MYLGRPRNRLMRSTGDYSGAVGISVQSEYEDEGENYYFDAFKR